MKIEKFEITAELNLSNFIEKAKEVSSALYEFIDKLESIEGGTKMTKDEIKKEIKTCEEKLKAEQERLTNLRKELDKSEYSGKKWKPEFNEVFFYISSEGNVHSLLSYVDPENTGGYQIGNCFKTREEAEFEVERLKVIAELKDFAEDDDAVWDGNKLHFYIYYSPARRRIDCGFHCTEHLGTLYFPSEEVAEVAIEAVGEERIIKYYLGVK